ncbi:pyrrolo-quinoline quinone [Haloferax mucosum ATCC BAA-1512]|uniref:Pyrrolo-quinoline quinone n=2 Tax=Haloferax mucosum TaxID=403181 RepID=M0IGP6_9EURY|nr:pyrrolo-quinoline quinone [Haloferax mucosum ATCC BAA-1512]
MGRCDSAGTGHHPTASGPKRDVEIAWSHDAPDWFLGTTPPIRLGNTLYAVGNGLLGLDTDTGERQFGHPGPYQSTPARVHSSVYTTATLAATSPTAIFGLNAGGGFDLSVPLFEHSFGFERWRGPKASGVGFFGPATPRAPVTADGTIYAALPELDSVAALDPDDGRVLWRDTNNEDDSMSSAFSRPAVKDGLVFVTNWPYRVTAYRAETGEQYWKRELGERILTSPVATDAGLVIQSREAVWLLDPDDGTALWKQYLDSNVTGSVPAVANETIFVADELESMHALDLETGEPRWQTPFDGETTPVVADGVVYAVKSTYSLVAIDAESGNRLFEYRPSQIPISTPVVGDGTLYAANRNRVIALEEAR